MKFNAAFKKWFGKSWVVDENGEPLVVYHGTHENFTEFKLSEASFQGLGQGFYFTDKSKVAQAYARDEGGVLVSAYLSLQNPAPSYVVMTISKELCGKSVIVRGMESELRKALIAEGYDGVMWESSMIDNETIFVAFYPWQIKSAIGNDGTYDADDADIRSNPSESSPEINLNASFWKWFGDSAVADADGNPLVVYHGTNKKFRKFNTRKSTQGIIWFSTDRDKIERGDAGASGRDVILKLFASIQRPAGWKEYERLLLAQIRQEYDGAILRDGGGGFDGFVFHPSQLKSIYNDGTWDADDDSIRSNPRRRR